MSEQWTPKVGDKVMVGEHGPYVVHRVAPGGLYREDLAAIYDDQDMDSTLIAEVPITWLTPEPELEPDEAHGRRGLRDQSAEFWWGWSAMPPVPAEPTAPGALVKIETGSGLRVAARISTNDLHPWVVTGHVGNWSWVGLKSFQSPITVILADPAEVETLRAEVESGGREVKAAWDRARQFKIERDELQRRIDEALALVDDPGYWSTYSQTRPMMRDILRGES